MTTYTFHYAGGSFRLGFERFDSARMMATQEVLGEPKVTHITGPDGAVLWRSDREVVRGVLMEWQAKRLDGDAAMGSLGALLFPEQTTGRDVEPKQN